MFTRPTPADSQMLDFQIDGLNLKEEVEAAMTDFFRQSDVDPHRARAPAILAAHPEVRSLIRRDSSTAWIALAIVVAQTAVAVGLGRYFSGNWLLATAAAALIGAFANHALYVVIHDATHGVVFRAAWGNRLVLLLADLPNVLPGAMAFRSYHLLHHSGRSQYHADPDIPNEWEARIVKNIWWRKILWLFLFPFLQVTRVGRVPAVPLLDGWSLANYCVNLAYAAAIWALAGWTGLIYLFGSFFFATGLHPLGIRWISEHYVLSPGHDTNSYYGPINKVALNIGYHNEHHDFPRVPWSRLPDLKRMAPEFYDDLPAHHSWLKLFYDFLFDGRYWLYSRVVRPDARPTP